MSAEITPYTPCAECCDCPPPEVLFKYRSASISKCGYDAGTVVCGTLNDIYLVLSRSGFCAIDPPESDFFCNSTQRQSASGGGYFTGDTTFDPDTCEQTGSPEYTTCSDPGSGGVQLIELSVPYTTAAMITRLDARLAAAAYSAFAAGMPVASFVKAVDELSAMKEESIYKISHGVPKVGSGLCYKLNWIERFTPADGGDPVDTARDYTWTGGDPESGEFTFAAPVVPGEITIGYYTDPEDPETFVEGFPAAECRGCVA